MGDLNKPDKRTFWKATSSDGTSVVHEGFTDGDQQTTTGQPNFDYSINAEVMFPILPSSGYLNEGEIYSYNNNMVIVRQSHERTIYPPEDTPALFSMYRETTEDMPWIAQENVIIGDTRTYNSQKYKCLQSHQTQTAWNPEATLGVLWSLVTSGNEWAAGVPYSVNQEVTYQGHTYKCLQAHTSQIGWDPPSVPALWQFLS